MTCFVSHLAPDLDAFLAFKRRMGHPYLRAEFTLREFDRFVAADRRHRRSFRMDLAVARWLAAKGGRKPVSVTVDLGVLRQFCLYLRRRDPAAFVPGRTWAPQSTESHFLPFVFTIAQVRDILTRATALGRPPWRGHLYRALILILYCTGVRFGEALRLRMSDVDIDAKRLFVAESKGRSRWVPFDRSLAKALRRYIAVRPGRATAGPDDRFLVGSKGFAVPINTASTTIVGLLRAAGLKPPTGRVGPRPYDFRHTFAVHRLTRWYREKVDISGRLPWLSAYMGHDDILGTETYLTATPELLALASRRFRRRLVRQPEST